MILFFVFIYLLDSNSFCFYTSLINSSLELVSSTLIYYLLSTKSYYLLLTPKTCLFNSIELLPYLINPFNFYCDFSLICKSSY